MAAIYPDEKVNAEKIKSLLLSKGFGYDFSEKFISFFKKKLGGESSGQSLKKLIENHRYKDSDGISKNEFEKIYKSFF